MNLLLLHPTPGLRRQRSYYQAALQIQQKTGHKVVMAYNGAVIPDLGNDIPVHNFNQWVKSNLDRITDTDIIDLEKRYPASNLWLALVAERRVTNYSLLDGSYPTVRFKYDELIFLLKALVLFYEEIIQKHETEVIFAHHPDNVHSSILFEMALSNKTLPLLMFPDYYWDNHCHFLFDSKYFTSSTLLECYRSNLADYDNRIKPLEAEISEYIARRVGEDPAERRKDVLPRLGLMDNALNAFKTLRRKDLKFYLFRPDVVEGFGQVCISASIHSFLHRSVNVIRNRVSSIYARQLPTEPFVYFPLQRVPEAAMLSRATAYLNQQGVAQALSAALPAGFKLVIKDHPRSTGIHPPKYYEKLLELPNVVVIHSTYSNARIFAKTALVVTIAGTLGFQRLLQGKPVVMFGRKFYECLAGVIRVPDMNELPYIMKRILIHQEVPDSETIKKSVYCFIGAQLMNRYMSKQHLFKLHHDPESLSALMADMLEREVPGLLKGLGP